MRKRVLSLFLVLVLCLTLMPAAAFAEGGEGSIISGGLVEAAASVIKSDGTDRGTFTSLTEALNEAEDGDLVKLLANHETDWSTVEAGDYSTLAVVKKTLTLDLNGKTVDYLVVGEVVPDEEGGILESTEGDLTIVENSQFIGSISGIQLEKGKLTIEGGEIGTVADTGSFICSDENGKVNIKGGVVWFFGCEGGTANISGGTLYQLFVSDEAVVNVSGGGEHGGWNDGSENDTSTWNVNGGTLNIKGGTFGKVVFSFTGGTVDISGGIFQSIGNSGVSTRTSVMSLLADGYAFCGKDADDAYTVVQDGRKTMLEDVKVLAHTTHTFVDGTCIACGTLTCNEKNPGDDDEGGCIAHVTISNYTWHLKTLDKIAYHLSASGQWSSNYKAVTVEFLSDVTTDTTFCINQCYTYATLDLNGHTISGELSGSPVAEVDYGYGVQRVIIQNGTIKNTAENGTALRLSDGATTLENVNVEGDLALSSAFVSNSNYINTFLGGGSFTKIRGVENDSKGTWSKKLKDMLGKGCYMVDSAGSRLDAGMYLGTSDNSNTKVLENVRCKACDHKDNNGEYTLLVTAETKYGAPAKRCENCDNLCPHDEITTDGSNTCTVCGLPIAIKATNLLNGKDLGPYYYTGLDDAMNEILHVHAGRRPIITLLADTESTCQCVWRKISDDGLTIDLAGHTLKLIGDNNKASSEKMKFRNTSDTRGKVLGTVKVYYTGGEMKLIIPDTDNNLTIENVLIGAHGTAELSGGSFGNIKIGEDCGKTLTSLLAEGYYFADTTSGAPAAMYDADGNVLTELQNVTVAKCTHDTAVCTPDGWKCPCGQMTFAASVTNGETTTYYEDLQNAFNAADGGTVKLMRSMVDVTVNIDKPFTLDLNGCDVYSLTVNNRITLKDSAAEKGKITEWLVVSSDLTIGDLLEEGDAFRYVSTGEWCFGTEQAVGNVTVEQAPIKNVAAVNPSVTVAYGKTAEVTLEAAVVPSAEGETVNYQWYMVGGTMPPITGATGSTYQLPDDLTAGTYTYRLTAEKDRYKRSCDFNVNVTPLSIKGATVEVKSLTYNGAEQTPAVTVRLGEKVLIENKDYTVAVTKQTDAGSYKLTVIGKGGYTDKIENFDWKIEPMQLRSFCHVESLSKPYDGTAAAPLTKSAVKFHSTTASFITLPEDAYDITNARFTMLQADKSYQDSPEAGSGKTLSFTVTLKSGNYVLEKQPEQRIIECSLSTDNADAFTITQIKAPAMTAMVSLYVTNRLAKTYELDLTSLLPETGSFKSYGDITYGAPNVILSDGYYETTSAKIENGKLTLPILENPIDTEGRIGEVRVNVITTNYEEFMVSFDVFARNKIVPELEGTVSASDITYGQTLSESRLTVTGKMKDAETTGEEVQGIFAWKDGTLKPNAGGYEAEWIFTPSVPEYAAATGKVTVRVKPKTVKISGITAVDKVYDGTTAATTDCSKAVFDGKLEGDDLTVAAIGEFRITEADRENDLVVDLSMALGGEDKDNYVIDITDSQRTAGAYILPATLTVMPNASQSKVFGSADPALLYTVSGAVNNEKPAFTGTLSREAGSDVGSYAITLGSLALRSDGSFKAYNYDLKLADAVVNFNIDKAAAPVLDDVTADLKYTVTSGKIGISGIMSSDAGQMTYTPGGAHTTGSVTVSGWSVNVDTGEVNYTLGGGVPGDTVTLSVTISSANYEDTAVNVIITLIEKDEQRAIRIIGDTTVVYGQTLALGTVGGSGSGAVTYRIEDISTGEAAIDQSTGILTPVKVGSVSIVATKADDDDYNEAESVPFVIMITPATPTGEPNYTAITAAGKTLNDAALTTEGSTLSPNSGRLEWVDGSGNVLSNDTVVEGNKTYKWRFTPDNSNYNALTGEVMLYYVAVGGGGRTSRCTVSFDTNGAGKLPNQTVTKNSVIKEPTAPNKEGFDFAGWYTDKELKTKYDFSAKVIKDLTLYAAWTQKDNSVNQIILTIGEKAAQVFGQTKTNDVAPKIVNSRTMLPARFVAENLGAEVLWDGEKELVTIKGKNLKTSEDITILIYIGSDIAYVNGKEIKLDSAAFIENDRTYTPIRFISEELGAEILWIEAEQKVVITK